MKNVNEWIDKERSECTCPHLNISGGSTFHIHASRAVTKALIGGGGVDIHILAFCPTNFF